METTKHFIMSFSQELINEPLLYRISTKFHVAFNISSANVSESQGRVALSLTGASDELESAIQYLLERGVELEEVNAPVSTS